MTNREAIRDIKEHIKVDGNGNIVIVGEISPVTIDMAIEALKNQESEKERIIKELEEKLEQSYYDGTRRNGKSIAYGMNIAYQDAIKIVKRGGKE